MSAAPSSHPDFGRARRQTRDGKKARMQDRIRSVQRANPQMTGQNIAAYVGVPLRAVTEAIGDIARPPEGGADPPRCR